MLSLETDNFIYDQGRGRYAVPGTTDLKLDHAPMAKRWPTHTSLQPKHAKVIKVQLRHVAGA